MTAQQSFKSRNKTTNNPGELKLSRVVCCTTLVLYNTNKLILNVMYINYLDALSTEFRHRKLTDLEIKIVTLLQKSISYIEIARIMGYEDGYIGDVARELYSLITEKHGIKVKKSNLFSTLDQFICSENNLEHCEDISYVNSLVSGVLKFKQDEILFNLSVWWQFNATKQSLVYKSSSPVIVALQDLQPDKLGNTLLQLTKNQLKSEAVSELLTIMGNYFE